MKPALAQFQSDKRKEREKKTNQNRLNNLRSEILLREMELQARQREAYISDQSFHKLDAKWWEIWK